MWLRPTPRRVRTRTAPSPRQGACAAAPAAPDARRAPWTAACRPWRRRRCAAARARRAVRRGSTPWRPAAGRTTRASSTAPRRPRGARQRAPARASRAAPRARHAGCAASPTSRAGASRAPLRVPTPRGADPPPLGRARCPCEPPTRAAAHPWTPARAARVRPRRQRCDRTAPAASPAARLAAAAARRSAEQSRWSLQSPLETWTPPRIPQETSTMAIARVVSAMETRAVLQATTQSRAWHAGAWSGR